MMKKIKPSSGQTLLEVVFVMAIITVALAGFVFTATRSVRSSTNTVTRSLASQYSQQGMEQVRQLRDRNWTAFLSYGDPDPTVRCPGNDAMTSWSIGPCDVGGEYTGIYMRSAEFDWDPAVEQMNVVVRVTWVDESGPHESSLHSVFTRM